MPGHTHTVATDEHMEDGVLISDEFTNPHKRRAMMEKRQRKVDGIEAAVPPPRLHGTGRRRRDPDRLGLDRGRHRRSARASGGAGHHRQSASDPLDRAAARRRHRDRSSSDSRHTIIVENNYSGQFARYLRSETSFVPDGHIRKYDGEPFMPHHIVEAVREQLAGDTTLSVPMHEIMV